MANQVASAILIGAPGPQGPALRQRQHGARRGRCGEGRGARRAVLVVGFDNISAVRQLVREGSGARDRRPARGPAGRVRHRVRARDAVAKKAAPSDRETPVDLDHRREPEVSRRSSWACAGWRRRSPCPCWTGSTSTSTPGRCTRSSGRTARGRARFARIVAGLLASGCAATCSSAPSRGARRRVPRPSGAGVCLVLQELNVIPDVVGGRERVARPAVAHSASA